MKARDLAALAALGIAGKYAYDKFGRKKDDEPKSKGKLGEAQSANDGDAGESEARMSKRDMNEGSGRRDAGGDADYQMPRTAPRTVPEDYDAPRTAPRQPVAVAKPVRKQEVEARSLDSTGGPSRYNRAADSNAAGSAYDAAAPVEQRMAALNAANGAASESARQTDALANTSRAAVMVDRANRTNPTAMRASGASTPSAKRTDKLAVGSRANQAAYLAQKRAAAPAVPAVVPTPAAPAPAAAPQQPRYTKDRYGNIIDNTTGKVSRTIYSAGQEGNAARVGMKRGGVVKMASGGMTSSKMSKPSGASRGDGIAQRGRTRGKYL